MIKVWRQQLHFWDTPNQPVDSGKESCSDLSVTLTTSDGSERKASLITETSDSEDQSWDDSLLLDDGFSDV